MELIYTSDKSFSKEHFSRQPLEKGEYDNCTFLHCDFSNSTLAGSVFINCEFIHCNLSLCKLQKTAFQNVFFKDSKLLGLRFDHCHSFGFSVRFEHCLLQHASFYRCMLKETVFQNTQLQEVDFTEADCSKAIFDHCDCADARFDQTNLEQADLHTVIHLMLDPERNRIKGAKVSGDLLPALLAKYELDIQ